MWIFINWCYQKPADINAQFSKVGTEFLKQWNFSIEFFLKNQDGAFVMSNTFFLFYDTILYIHVFS